MAKLGDVFRSNSWKASDLETAQVLTISAVKPYEFDDGMKLIISFEGSDKDLICNKTNSNTIGDSYGDETDNWVGQRIQLYKTQTEFQGRRVDCIRVQGPKSQSSAPPPPDFGDDPGPGDGSDLPF